MDDTGIAKDNAVAGPSWAVEDNGNQSNNLFCKIIKAVVNEDFEEVLSKPSVKEKESPYDEVENELDTESTSDLDEDQAIISDELVLDEQGYIDTDPLPEGWTSIRHESGMNLYIGPGRVCTTARPYFLGAGSVRRHDVPRCAIPCLSYIFESSNPTNQEVNVQTAQEISLPEEVDIDSDQVAIPSWEETYAVSTEEDPAPVSNFATVDKTNTEQDFAMVEILSDSDDDDVPRQVLVIEEIDDDYDDVVTEETFDSSDDVIVVEYSDMLDCFVQVDVAVEETNPPEDFLLEERVTVQDYDDEVVYINRDEVAVKGDLNNDEVAEKEDLNNDEFAVKEDLNNDEFTMKIDLNNDEGAVKEDDKNDDVGMEQTNNLQQENCDKIRVLQDVTIRDDGVVINNVEDDKNLETAKEDIKDEAKNISTEELGEYCQRLFLFKKIRVMRFNSWSERRQFSKRRKHVHQLHRPAPLEPKVIIKCPIQSKEGESSKKWLMNTAGKSHVCILHEYVQHSLKKQPKYTFSELENAATPYAATVTINDMKYGVGYGTSKKQAKSNAAKATLQILIPEMDKPPEENPTAISEDVDISNIAFFDSVRILDPRVSDFCARTTEPLPCDLLKACLQRNENIGEMNITYEGNGECDDEEMLKFTMTVGPHQATVSCKNKREAKQQAAQAILQKLHPHVHSWGALLRLYGSGGFMGFKEKLTQKSSEQNPALHVPQEHKVQTAAQSLNETILQGLRGRFDLLRVKGLEVPYVMKEYSSQPVPSPPVPQLTDPE